MDESPEDMRKVARQWAELSRSTPYLPLRREYAAKALDLALRAEALTRRLSGGGAGESGEQPERSDSRKAVARSIQLRSEAGALAATTSELRQETERLLAKTKTLVDKPAEAAPDATPAVAEEPRR
jgi:hypothetical protein